MHEANALALSTIALDESTFLSFPCYIWVEMEAHCLSGRGWFIAERLLESPGDGQKELGEVNDAPREERDRGCVEEEEAGETVVEQRQHGHGVDEHVDSVHGGGRLWGCIAVELIRFLHLSLSLVL